MALDQPGIVVDFAEREQRLPQLLDGTEGPYPEQVLLQRADEPLGATSPSISSPAIAAVKPAFAVGAKKAAWNDYYMLRILARQAHARTLQSRAFHLAQS